MKLTIRLFFMVLMSSVICANVFGQSVPFPQLTGTTPGIILYTPDTISVISVNGNNLRPRSSAFGASDFTVNSNVDNYKYIAMQVITVHGQRGQIIHCNGQSMRTTGCVSDNWGNDSSQFEVNTKTFAGWSDGSELILSFHLLMPGPNGLRDVSSNELHIPFIRTYPGPPIFDSILPAGFQTNSTNWQVEVQGRMIDKTAYLDFGIDRALPLPLPTVDVNGTGVFSATIPETVRGRGEHQVRLCRLLMDYKGSTSKLCSAPLSYNVTMVLEHQGPAASNVNNLRVNPSVLLPEQVTVICASTPLYVDTQLNLLTNAGKPMYAKAGQSFQATRGTVQGSNGKVLRSLSNSGTSYIDAACVK